MASRSKIFKLEGVVQHYAWGGKNYIPSLLGIKASDQACAEYWMGAHDKSPSLVQRTSEKLNALISEDPDGYLGSRVSERFGRLPYLFKVLDVRDMLSIQVHPTKQEAEIGFEKENKLGVPLEAAHRNYKDDNHKPEIMVALSDFWLLHGFRSEEGIRKVLREVPEFQHLVSVFENAGYRGLYQQVMEESTEATSETLKPMIDRLLPAYEEGVLDKATPEYWAIRAFKTFCTTGSIDKGIYSIFLFNIVKLNEGEAIFQDAGVPHAYMEGQNIELMANSDNVLRGGLTPKHVDVPELLQRVQFNATDPVVLNGETATQPSEKIYPSPVDDFELSKVALSAREVYKGAARSFEIAIVMAGEVVVSDESESLRFRKGEVLAVAADTKYTIKATNKAVLYKAACKE